MKRNWNRWFLALLCISLPFSSGCQCMMQYQKNFQSQTVGINRTTRVYSYDGDLLGQWSSLSVIDSDTGGLTTFFDSTGHRVLINGGILVSVEH